MVERPGDLLEKAALMHAVWPGSVVEEGNLTQCIFTLRRAFGYTAGGHRLIVTVPGRGYQFAARVQTIDALPIESVTHVDSRDASDPDTIAAVRSKRSRTRVLWLAGSTATVVLVAGPQAIVLATHGAAAFHGVSNQRRRLRLHRTLSR